MRHRSLISRLLINMMGILAFGVFPMVNVKEALADRDHRPQHRSWQDHKRYDRHDHPRYGHEVRRLPQHHRHVHVKGNRYYHHNGTFYRKGPKGYIIVRPPIGALVMDVPIGFTTFFLAGLTYYYFGGVYYRRVPNGYMVVEEPRDTVIVDESPSYSHDNNTYLGMAMVDAEMLNVRSGPGVGYSVVYQLRRGDRVRVIRESREWIYVKLPNGGHGWVMDRFTYRIDNPANG